jgi:hypothetical protein
MVKRYEPIYASHMGISEVVDTRPVNYTPQEQQFLFSNTFTNTRLFEFLVRPAAGEGDIGQKLYNINIRNFGKGQWPDVKRIAGLRQQLAARTGVPVAEILTEIEQRQNAIIAPSPTAYEQDDIPPQNRADDDKETGFIERRRRK